MSDCKHGNSCCSECEEEAAERAQEFTLQMRKLTDERDRARIALKDLFLMMDENILVRNTENDGDQSWAMKMLDVVTRLKWAHDSIDFSARQDNQACKHRSVPWRGCPECHKEFAEAAAVQSQTESEAFRAGKVRLTWDLLKLDLSTDEIVKMLGNPETLKRVHEAIQQVETGPRLHQPIGQTPTASSVSQVRDAYIAEAQEWQERAEKAEAALATTPAVRKEVRPGESALEIAYQALKLLKPSDDDDSKHATAIRIALSMAEAELSRPVRKGCEHCECSCVDCGPCGETASDVSQLNNDNSEKKR